MARVLVIEDESDVQRVLDHMLRRAGYEAVGATSGAVGLRLARNLHPDAILLDLMLPDVSGTEVCRELKASDLTQDIPVIMVTAKADEIDRVVGFELGADDYVVKPFSIRELLLRLRRILERSSIQVSPPAIYTCGVLRVDRSSHRTWVADTEVPLTTTEFKLMVTLMEQPDRVLSREWLLREIWGVGAGVGLRTVDAYVKRLRARLRIASDYVETVRGVGYRFAGMRVLLPR